MKKRGRLLITGCGGFAGGHLLAAAKNRTDGGRGYLSAAAEQADAGMRMAAGTGNGVSGSEEEACEMHWVIYAGVLNEAESRRVDLPPAQILQADMTDRAAVFRMVETARPDAVVHLAAQASVAVSFREPELTRRVNVDGTKYLLEALRLYAPTARILIVGSVDQYGCVPDERQPIKENEPLTGQSPYGESKRLQEALARSCVREYGQDIILARAAPHVGPGQSRQFAIADWAAQITEMRRQMRPHVLSVGNLSVVRDICDVRDVVRAYLLLLQYGKKGEVYNVGTGTGVRLADIPPMLAALAGIPDLQIQTDAARLRPADIPKLVPDIGRLQACTGFVPQHTIFETLQTILAYDAACL